MLAPAPGLAKGGGAAVLCPCPPHGHGRTMVQLKERRRLGKSSVRLPPLGIGCAPIGEIYDRISDAQAADTFEAALRRGIRYFDVAPSYGVGLAEMRIGRALRRAAHEEGAFHVPRGDVFLSTKVRQRLVPDPTATPNTRNHADTHGWAGGLYGFNSEMNCTYEGFMTQHTESLHRMGLANVDGLLIHGPGSPSGAPEDWKQLTDGGGFRALRELRQRGAVSALGCGFGGPYETCRAVLDACPMDYMCLASVYSLLTQPVHEDGTLELCKDRDCGVVIFAPFNGGILVGGSKAAANRSKFNYMAADDSIIERVAALEAVAEKHAVPLAAAALQFPLTHPAVSSVVCGVASPAELEQNCDLLETQIPLDLWRDLQERGLVSGSVPIDPQRLESPHASL